MFRFNKQMIMNALPGEKREGFLYQRVLTELSGKQTCIYLMHFGVLVREAFVI